MIKVDNQLEEMKREYERRMRICYERQKEFEVKQKELDFQVGNLSFLDVHIDVNKNLGTRRKKSLIGLFKKMITKSKWR